MMRRLSQAATGLALLLAPAALRAQGITAAPGGQMSSLAGLAFDVPVVVDMSARPELLGAFAARLTWDPTRLRLDASTAGNFGSITAAMDSAPQGILRFAGANPAGASGRITVTTLRFTPLMPDTATLDLVFSQLFAAQSFADLLPSLTVNNGQFCPARGRFGDLDRDGTANSRDALITLSAAVGINVAPNDTSLGDVDANGIINARDALGILTHTVGLPAAGFRMMALALGSCAIGGPVTLQIAPGVTGALVIGQTLRLEARAADGAGGLQAIPDAIWRSSDNNVLVVGPDGAVSARGAGTAVITALRAGQDSASLTIAVVARRSRHFVDAAALQAANGTGSAALPYGRLRDAILQAGDQDTIQLRVGRYEPGLALISQPRLTIIGDTTAAGLRPVIAGDGPQAGGFGLMLAGNQDVTVMDVGFENLNSAVSVQGGGRLRLAGLRGALLGSIVLANGPVGHLRLERSQVSGHAQSFQPALLLVGPADTVVVSDAVLSDFGGDFIFGNDVDSVAVYRSRVFSFGGTGLELDNIEGRGGLALVVDSTQLRRFVGDLFDLSDVRAVVIERTTLESDDDMISVYNTTSGGFLRLRNDSLLSRNGDDWLSAEGLDSVIVDSVQADLDDTYGYVYNVALTRVSDSRFTGPYYFLDADLGGSSSAIPSARVELRRSSISGPADCSQCGYGLQVYDNISVLVDSVNFSNLSYAVEVYSDTSAVVTHSTFRNTYYGIEYDLDYYPGCTAGCGYAGSTVTLAFNTFEGSEQAIGIYSGNAVIDSNTILASDDEVEIDTYGSVQFTRNRVNAAYGLEVDSDDSTNTVVISDNVFTVRYEGVDVDGETAFPDTIRSRFIIQRNQVTCAGYSGSSYGLDLSDAHLMVTDNVVTGCSYGIYLSTFADSTRSDTLLRNRIVLPPGPYSYGGIVQQGYWRSLIRGNHLSGPADAASGYGMMYLSGNTGMATVARVEADTIVGGLLSGVYASYFDTLDISRNVINDAAQSSGYAGIYVAGDFGPDTLRVRGNQVRRSLGSGVRAALSTSGPLVIDSNLVYRNDIGMHLESGVMVVRRNMIDTSTTYGISVGFGPTVTVDGNNIQGNRLHGIINPFAAAVTAANNWWGHPSGPSCSTGCNSPAGDSVSTNVTGFSAFLAAPAGNTPPPTVAPVQPIVAGLRSPSLLAAGSRRPAPVTRVRAPGDAALRPIAVLGATAAAERASRHQAQAAREAARAERRAVRDRGIAAQRQARLEEERADSTARAQRRQAAATRRP